MENKKLLLERESSFFFPAIALTNNYS